MLNFRKAKLFRRHNILIMSIYLIFSTKICGFSFFGHPVWLKQPFIGLVYPFWKKCTKMFNFRKAKLFRSPDILIMNIQLIFSTKLCGFSFFGHPVLLEQPFIGLVYPFLNKGSQNAQLQEGKTFQETQYFDHVHISHFFHQNMWIFIFWTSCIAKINFNWLGLSIF